MLKTLFDPHYIGLRHWMLQRATAVVIAVYTLVIAGLLAAHAPLSYESWQALFRPAWFKLLSLLFMVSLCLHAWLGVKDIIADYVRSPAWKAALKRLLVLALWVNLGWSVLILWSV